MWFKEEVVTSLPWECCTLANVLTPHGHSRPQDSTIPQGQGVPKADFLSESSGKLWENHVVQPHSFPIQLESLAWDPDTNNSYSLPGDSYAAECPGDLPTITNGWGQSHMEFPSPRRRGKLWRRPTLILRAWPQRAHVPCASTLLSQNIVTQGSWPAHGYNPVTREEEKAFWWPAIMTQTIWEDSSPPPPAPRT